MAISNFKNEIASPWEEHPGFAMTYSENPVTILRDYFN
jgi:hypothetical protein